MAYAKAIEPFADYVSTLYEASSSISTPSIQHLFNLSELLCIDYMNDHLHDLTSNKILHIANICSSLFGRVIDQYMIAYAISMIWNGFFPVLNPYGNLQDILNTYAVHNGLYTITSNVIMPIPEQSCSECGQTFTKRSFRRVDIYKYDETIVNGLVIYYSCSHSGTMKSQQPAQMLYPNFFKTSDGHIFTQKTFNNSNYLYIGGDNIFERKILLQFETLLVTSHCNFQGFIESFNLMHNYEWNDQCFAERRNFSLIWIIYEIITYAFFMGYEEIILPSTMDREKNDGFFYAIFQPLNELFIKFWLNHSEYKSCGLTCTRALIVDGNQKMRRRICLDKTRTITTAEIPSITVGCDQTPLYGSLYCAIHLPELQKIPLNRGYCDNNNNSVSEPIDKPTLNQKKLRSKTILIEHEPITCSTLKQKPNQYIDKCLRSFGFIVYATNCSVVVAFTEIFRSETIKEILNGLISIVNISPSLPPCLVYDDACHLIRRLIDGQLNGEFNVTPALLYLNKKTYNIDRMHIINHIDKWCKKYLDPDKNILLSGINTEACEQLFSWTNGYATAFTNMNASRCRLMLLLTFHLRNCFLKNIDPHQFNTGKFIVTKYRPLII